MFLTRVKSLFVKRPRVDPGEEGFSIIEVLVAFTLLAIVTLGTVPLFVAGLRGSLVSRLDTGAKNLSQERFEQMRNYPFHVDVNVSLVTNANCATPAGVATQCDHRDLLDNYFRAVGTLAPATNKAGYVAGASVCTAAGDICAGNGRTKDEPATGPFYRYGIDPIAGFQGRYSQFVATQFLSVNLTPLAPASDYDSQVEGKDFPPSRLIGVTVVTRWQAGSLSKKFVAFTQISEGKAGPPAVTLQARATAIKITGSMPPASATSPEPLFTMEAGLSASDGGLSAGGSASTKVLSSSADIAPGTRAEGKSGGASAPPSQTIADGDGASYTLTDSGETVAFSLGGQTRNVKASIVSDQPLVATSSAPATGRVKENSPCPPPPQLNLGYRNRLAAPAPGQMLGLDLSQYLVRIDETCPGNGNRTASGATYLTSVGGASHSAEAGAQAHSQTIKIVPTSFAEDGIVQVTLNRSNLVCKTNGTSSTGTSADYEAKVRYLKYNVATNLNEYTEVTVEDGQALSPLTDALLTGTQVSLNPGSSPANLVLLTSYIQTWGSLTNAATDITSPAKRVTSALNGIVSVTTQPTRAASSASAVTVAAGILSCVAEDNR